MLTKLKIINLTNALKIIFTGASIRISIHDSLDDCMNVLFEYFAFNKMYAIVIGWKLLNYRVLIKETI